MATLDMATCNTLFVSQETHVHLLHLNQVSNLIKVPNNIKVPVHMKKPHKMCPTPLKTLMAKTRALRAIDLIGVT